MAKRILHSILSFVLAVLLIFGSTAKEYIHLFADHTDTTHDVCEKRQKGENVEQEHHHCKFLTYSVTPYINDVQVVDIPTPTSAFYIAYGSAVSSLTHRTVSEPQQRGPPIYS